MCLDMNSVSALSIQAYLKRKVSDEGYLAAKNYHSGFMLRQGYVEYIPQDYQKPPLFQRAW